MGVFSMCKVALVLPVLLATIVVAGLGLSGQLGLHQVSTGTLVTSVLSGNVAVFIVSVMGLCGATSVGIVSGVALGFAILEFMIVSVIAVACTCRTLNKAIST